MTIERLPEPAEPANVAWTAPPPPGTVAEIRDFRNPNRTHLVDVVELAVANAAPTGNEPPGTPTPHESALIVRFRNGRRRLISMASKRLVRVLRPLDRDTVTAALLAECNPVLLVVSPATAFERNG